MYLIAMLVFAGVCALAAGCGFAGYKFGFREGEAQASLEAIDSRYVADPVAVWLHGKAV